MFYPLKIQKYIFKKKRSKFISFIKPCNNILDFRSWLSQLKNEYYDASHFCWAYRVYDSRVIEQNYSDSGEPKGTAGRPIMKVLKEAELINCIIVVIRYFGGTKLGKSGLIECYYQAAHGTIENLKLSSWVKRDRYAIECNIKYYSKVMILLSNYKIKILVDKSSDVSKWIIDIPESKVSPLLKKINEKARGSLSFKRI